MEAYVICSIPTATSPINDIEFEVESGALGKDQVLRSAKPVPADVAAYFGEIPGYTIEPVVPKKEVVRAPTAPVVAQSTQTAPSAPKPAVKRPSAAEIAAQAAAEAPPAVVAAPEPEVAADDAAAADAAEKPETEADGEIF